MFISVRQWKWWLLLSLAIPFFFSCRTYNNAVAPYYDAVSNGRFDDAASQLDKARFFRYGRNKLLFNMEKGKTAFLQGRYQESNLYFNAADSLLNSHRGSKVLDQTLGLVVNPAMQIYQGEDFERLLIHYYKSINYLKLHQVEEAEVEARRITLGTYALNDRKKNSDKKYSNDAFSLIVQGIVYESAGDVNNAFISYRNAADIFLKNPDHRYYGVEMPAQLQVDLLHTASQLGFSQEVAYYEKQFGRVYQPPTSDDGGAVLVIWENGLAPVKAETNFFFTLTERGPGNFVFTDPNTQVVIPFDFNLFPRDSCHQLRRHLEAFRVAFPSYVEQPLYYTAADIQRDSTFSTTLEKVEDVNQLAFRTLQERFLKEMGLALTRLAIKKLAEYEIRKNDEVAGELFNLLTLLAEKADTRNWQSLPHSIYYSRIPLKKGDNKITLTLKGKDSTQKVEFNIIGNGRLQTWHYASLLKS
ncbi:COG3014 family protein [Chitinophaga qingshengii]|uniref:Tetratricopeptide repeat protein n=1 Tax=Chitinophaga qingshengii TaxID=1569794 RepID=A0ABR7THP6_9BACT|nr:hypothetical protein [Chitinophaga qingshengii]MBC9930020.1 hypothetical protein [Chitinophaga qingshengii]